MRAPRLPEEIGALQIAELGQIEPALPFGQAGHVIHLNGTFGIYRHGGLLIMVLRKTPVEDAFLRIGKFHYLILSTVSLWFLTMPFHTLSAASLWFSLRPMRTFDAVSQ